MNSTLAAAFALAVAAAPVMAAPTFTFPSIDGGTIALSDWAGRPVLVVNTASLCAFTPQYEGLQALYDRYRDRGLVVFAVPSDAFRQELGSGEEVKAFCELTYGIDMPMADITDVRGKDAHPFYRWLAEDHGFEPAWNFAKVLIGPTGEFVAGWGPAVLPEAGAIAAEIEALLPE
jgi:glutathione peroxidase